MGVFISMTCAFLLLLSDPSFAQDFEGYIEYEIAYKVHTPTISIESLEQNFGTKSRTYFKNGFYKEITNSTYYSFQLFRYDKSEIYFTHEVDDTLRISSIEAKDKNQKFEYEVFENAATVLGINCHKLVVKDGFGTKSYYYSSKYSLDAEFYRGFTSSNKDKILDLMEAVYLKLDMEYPYYTVFIEATKIKREKLNPTCFQIPKSKNFKYEN